MKSTKILLALMLALTLIVGLCACGGNETEETEETKETKETVETKETEETEETEESEEASGATEYLLTVVDEDGNPISGVMVQLCNDTNCYPCKTDEDGKAKLVLLTDDYVAKLSSLPEGYDYATDEQEFELDGQTELTIVLKVAE